MCMQLHLRVLQLVFVFFFLLYFFSCMKRARICCQPIKNRTHIDAIDWFYFSIEFWRHVLMCIGGCSSGGGGGAIFIVSYIYYRPQLFQTSLTLTHWDTHESTATTAHSQPATIDGMRKTQPAICITYAMFRLWIVALSLDKFWMFGNLVYEWHLFDFRFWILHFAID